jgi:pimeloyl-ACP methyl ester carboxylesterase
LALRSRHHWALLSDSAIPKLLIHGTQDKFGALSILRTYAAEVGQAAWIMSLDELPAMKHFRWHADPEVCCQTLHTAR